MESVEVGAEAAAEVEADAVPFEVPVPADGSVALCVAGTAGCGGSCITVGAGYPNAVTFRIFFLPVPPTPTNPGMPSPGQRCGAAAVAAAKAAEDDAADVGNGDGDDDGAGDLLVRAFFRAGGVDAAAVAFFPLRPTAVLLRRSSDAAASSIGEPVSADTSNTEVPLAPPFVQSAGRNAALEVDATEKRSRGALEAEAAAVGVEAATHPEEAAAASLLIPAGGSGLRGNGVWTVEHSVVRSSVALLLCSALLGSARRAIRTAGTVHATGA